MKNATVAAHAKKGITVVQGASVAARRTNPARIIIGGVNFTSENPRNAAEAEVLNKILDGLEEAK